jgi:N-acetylmuramoyl-L-alanine amidase
MKEKARLCLLLLIVLPLFGCENIKGNEVEAMAANDEFIVTIDAGHGGSGSTPGKRACDGSFYEWEINNEVAIKVEELLEEQGVIVERVDDVTGKTDVPLHDRLVRALNYGTDLHISIHQNSDRMQSEATGVEVYYNSASNERNIAFATDLARRMSDYIVTKNRGWKASNGDLFITREFCRQGIDVVLAEGLFMTNSDDIKYMETKDYAKDYGSAIADSVLIVYRNEIINKNNEE